jgi:hypothetical protein
MTKDMLSKWFHGKGNFYPVNWWKIFFRDLLEHGFVYEETIYGRSKYVVGTVVHATDKGKLWYNKVDKKYTDMSLDTEIAEDDRYNMMVTVALTHKPIKDDQEQAVELMEQELTEESAKPTATPTATTVASAGKKWTKVEEDQLLVNIKTMSVKDTATKHQRTEGAIRSRLRSIACDLYNASKKTDKDLDSICKTVKMSKAQLLKALEDRKLYTNSKNSGDDENAEVFKQLEQDLAELEASETPKTETPTSTPTTTSSKRPKKTITVSKRKK